MEWGKFQSGHFQTKIIVSIFSFSWHLAKFVLMLLKKAIFHDATTLFLPGAGIAGGRKGRGSKSHGKVRLWCTPTKRISLWQVVTENSAIWLVQITRGLLSWEEIHGFWSSENSLHTHGKLGPRISTAWKYDFTDNNFSPLSEAQEKVWLELKVWDLHQKWSTSPKERDFVVTLVGYSSD